MGKIFTVAILGCGSRGANAYGRKMFDMPDKYKIVSLCDINPEKLRLTKETFSVPDEETFTDENEFFKKKRADVIVIATQDQDHVRHCVKALELGYDVLLEKPLTKTKKGCDALLNAQKKYGGKVLVCHVLRYAPAFIKAAELIDSGAIGRLVEIDNTEQVAFWHQAHSFVRGNWRRSDETSPMILAKCCHDLDLLQFFAKSKCKSLSSVGDLTFFTPENAPEGAAERCLDCKYIDTCPYSAKQVYITRFGGNEITWPSSAITLKRPLTAENVMEALKDGPYGRCVFHCDNNVVDHQLTTMTFENGVKATLTMVAFTGKSGRLMFLRGTLGEVIVDEEHGKVILKQFMKDTQEWEISSLVSAGDGHGGGDSGIVGALYETLAGGKEGATTLKESIESHLMGIAAEKSRLAGGKLTKVHR
ncbi:MAG: Gfo/Idh/MocA family oxidoreductase [Clostridia bacterium]|nr:Gfo/Idh/MocA family oxidoreductase [Clostridia bacterium]